MNYNRLHLSGVLSQFIRLLKKYFLIAPLIFFSSINSGLLLNEFVWGRGFFAYPLQGVLPFFMLSLAFTISVFLIRTKRNICLNKSDMPGLLFLLVFLVFSSNYLDHFALILIALLFLVWSCFKEVEKKNS